MKTALFALANLATAVFCGVVLALLPCYPLSTLAVVAVSVAGAVTLTTGLGNLVLWKRWGW